MARLYPGRRAEGVQTGEEPFESRARRQRLRRGACVCSLAFLYFNLFCVFCCLPLRAWTFGVCGWYDTTIMATMVNFYRCGVTTAPINRKCKTVGDVSMFPGLPPSLFLVRALQCCRSDAYHVASMPQLLWLDTMDGLANVRRTIDSFGKCRALKTCVAFSL